MRVDEGSSESEEEELDPRVIGGRNAEEGEFPWMVSLHYKGRFVCSAFLITPRVLMTAAHCLVFGEEPEEPGDYTGYAGTVSRDGPEQKIAFTEIIAHEEYGYSTEYDIGLMRLAEPVQLNDRCRPVCLPANNSVYENMTAQVVGWGVTEKWGHEPARTLQTATERVPTFEMCEFTYAVLGIPVTRRHICAGGDKDKGVCFDLVNIDRMFTDPDNELDPRVIGGRDALDGEFPWMVALHYQGRFVCSSFLVTPKILMTAAHCVVFGNEPEDPKHYNGYAGTIHRDGPETEIRFTEIVAHSEYGSGTEYDIALMKLAEPLPLNDRIQTICLPTKDSLYEDMTAQVVGWGVSEKGGRESAKILQTATENVPTNDMCTFTYGILGIPVTKKHVCAGGERDKGICFGDSGGPLVATNETKPVAIGVASFGSYLGCAANRVPAVYTATAMYTDWIVEKMGDEAQDACFIEKTSQPRKRWWG